MFSNTWPCVPGLAGNCGPDYWLGFDSTDTFACIPKDKGIASNMIVSIDFSAT